MRLLSLALLCSAVSALPPFYSPFANKEEFLHRVKSYPSQLNEIGKLHPVALDKQLTLQSDLLETKEVIQEAIEEEPRVTFVESMNQVTPTLFIGDDEAAMDYELLKSNKITHIINLATGVENLFPNVSFEFC